MMDVARLAGVSHQTVSRVLNHPDTVRPATLQRVHEAITQLGYRPNLAARALVTDTTRTIGVLTTGLGYHGPAATTAAIEATARARGYACIVTALADVDPADVGDALRFLISRSVDAIVAVASQHGVAHALADVCASLPVVVVADGLSPASRMHVVSVDQELGARQGVSHLIQCGYRDIIHLAGPADWYDAQARLHGWRGALEDAGLAVAQPIVGDWSAACGYDVGMSLARSGLPEAVLCGNDLMALGLMAALHDSGVPSAQIPGIVGFDDIDGAAYVRPALTTIRQPFDELGRLCLDVTLRAIAGEQGTSHSIAPELRVRSSTQRGGD